MMELALLITGPRRQTKRVSVTSARFTIGSAPDNDLVIEGAGLGRRHLLIESFDGIAQAVDCGSGVLLNGQPVAGVARLTDRDLLILADGCEVEVRLESGVAADQRRTESFNETRQTAKGKQILATVIAVAALVALASALRRELAGSRERQSEPVSAAVSDGGESISSEPDTNKKGGVSPEPGSAIPVKRLARQVMSRISRDPRSYDFSDEVMSEVERKVGQYRYSPSLAEALRSIRRDGNALAAEIRGEIEPSLVFYTTLAEKVEHGSARDTMAAARAALIALREIRKDLGTDTADSCLIVVAVYRMKKRSLTEILPRVENAAGDVYSVRTVWGLHDRGQIDGRTFDFVLSFIAVGVIAQDPRAFGIMADPLL